MLCLYVIWDRNSMQKTVLTNSLLLTPLNQILMLCVGVMWDSLINVSNESKTVPGVCQELPKTEYIIGL
jgi:hypothetical protein